jgi:hypothetical protein
MAPIKKTVYLDYTSVPSGQVSDILETTVAVERHILQITAPKKSRKSNQIKKYLAQKFKV